MRAKLIFELTLDCGEEAQETLQHFANFFQIPEEEVTAPIERIGFKVHTAEDEQMELDLEEEEDE